MHKLEHDLVSWGERRDGRGTVTRGRTRTSKRQLCLVFMVFIGKVFC